MFILNQSFDIDYLHLRICWIRNMKKTASFAFDRIRIPYTLIWIVLDGRLQLEINGNVRWAAPGDVIMCPPGTHFGLIPRSDHKDIHYLSFCADMKIGNLDLVSLYGLPEMASMNPSEELNQWVDAWKSLVGVFDDFGERVNAKTERQLKSFERSNDLHPEISIQYLGMKGLVYQWMHLWLNQLRDHVPVDQLRFDQRIMTVCDYVSERLDQPLRLQELANQAFISTSQLSYLFAEVLGISPMEYVRRTRLEYARQLLMNTSLSLHEIATKIGYSDQSQFSRAFRRQEGLSPSMYRSNITN